MRSPSSTQTQLEKIRQAYLGDPEDPNYSYRLTAFDLERMAQMHRAVVIGELVAEGLLFVARLPGRLVRLVRGTRAETMREAGAD
jgi:hypothetical protein